MKSSTIALEGIMFASWFSGKYDESIALLIKNGIK